MKKQEKSLRESDKLKPSRNADFDTDKYLEDLRKKLVAEREPYRTPKPKFFIFLLLLIPIILLALVFLIKPIFIGFVTFEKEMSFNETINLEFSSNSEYTWNVGNLGDIKGIRLSGKLQNRTSARVYIENEGVRYLIFNSTGLQENLEPSNKSENLITGFAVKEDKEKDKENWEFNKTIIINLQYKSNTVYDEDNNGFELETGIVDFTVENTSFNFDADNSKLCTRWEVYSIDSGKSTSVCYGNSECCAFIGLLSARSDWNEPFYLSYNYLGSTYNNIVGAQVIYINESYVAFSSLSNLSAKFVEEGLLEFENVCIETCAVNGFNKSAYKLVVEVDKGKVVLDKISYNTRQLLQNNPPQFVGSIGNYSIRQGSSLTINLSSYFFDKDDDLLNYKYYDNHNFKISIQGDIATISANKNFSGLLHTFFIANDSEDIAVSNVFSINVTAPAQIVQLQAKIGEPVKWKKMVKIFDKNNIRVNITSEALNVTVKKVSEDKEEIIDKSNIKVKVNNIVKDLEIYELERKLQEAQEENDIGKIAKLEQKLNEAALASLTGNVVSNLETPIIINESKINQTAELIISENIEPSFEELQIEYETSAPKAVEENLSELNKRITISADLPYENVLTFTAINDAPKEAIKLYWIKDGARELFNDVAYYDLNDNGLVDYIEWVVPHLSNQTFEVSITILNVQSYPTVGGNWTVAFNTTGTGNLTITASNGTSYAEKEVDDSGTINDLDVLELRCENNVLEPLYIVDLGNLSLEGPIMNKDFINKYLNISNQANSSVVERARSLTDKAPLSLRGRCGFEIDSEISPRSHLCISNEKEEKQAHSLNKNTSLAKGNFDEFVLDSENHRDTHTLSKIKQNLYLNVSIFVNKLANFFSLIPSAYALHFGSGTYNTININGKTYSLLTKEQLQGHSYKLIGIYYENYNCDNKTGYWTVRVLTSGVHTQRFNFSEQIAYAHNLALDPGFCDGGDLTTTCWINSTKYINSSFEILNANNLIINASGKILNSSGTLPMFTINLTGNLTIDSGGIINLSAVSCSSGTCKSGGNLTILANAVNVSGKILSEGGQSINAFTGVSGNGGILNINASIIYIGNNGELSVSSDYLSSTTNSLIGGNAGVINFNSSIVNITGTLRALGGNGQRDICNSAGGAKGSGGIINITSPTISNTGLINVEKGAIGYCDVGGINSGRDGQIWFNGNWSPCNNGTILDWSACQITKGHRVPANYVWDLSGKNLTLGAGARINADGNSCNSGSACQSGESFTIIVNMLNLSNGNITSNGGSNTQVHDIKSGDGGNITINASQIFVGINSEISVSSDYVMSTNQRLEGGHSGGIILNVTFVNITGKLVATGGNGGNTFCQTSNAIGGEKGKGGIINISSPTVSNTGIINVEKGTIGYCDVAGINSGRDGQIWVNGNWSPCNNGTILDWSACQITKGHRVPSNYIWDLSGKNLTLGAGARINADGNSCRSGTCQSGEDFTIIANIINLSTGNISSDGGSSMSFNTATSGDGGNITINASQLFIISSSQISASSDYVVSTTNPINGGKAGIITLNATTINITGKIIVTGGNGDSDTCSSTVGKRGNGGNSIINSINADIRTLDANRGGIGLCNNGYGGSIIINATNELSITGLITAAGNLSGNITLSAYQLLLNTSAVLNVTNGTQTNSGLNGTINLQYNLTINISTATIIPPPFLIKENEFGRVQFINRISGYANFDINKSINITNNLISVNSEGGNLNLSANLTIKNLINGTIRRNGVNCGDICYWLENGTDANGLFVKFNVSQFSNYSIVNINPNVSTSFSIQNPVVNDMLNFSGNISDEEGLSSANITYNISGVITKLNFSISGKNVEVSNVTILPEVGVINFTMFATDLANNIVQNSTLLSVYHVPAVRLDSPSNYTWNGTNYQVLFFYTPSDDNLQNCTLFTNQSGTWKSNITNSTPISDQVNNFTMQVNDSISGLFVWDIFCNDTQGFTSFNGSNYTLRIDSEFPKISFGNYTKINNSNASQNYIFVNVSVIEPNFANITFYLYRGNQNFLNETNFTTQTFNINFTRLSEGSYYYNVTVRDLASKINSTSTRFITLDYSHPNVTFLAPSPLNSTAGDDDIVLNWTAIDSIDINLTCYPNIDGTLQSAVSTPNGTNASAALTIAGGNHTLKVVCFDDANNSNATEERKYTAAIVNITIPAYDEIIRPSENVRFNVSVLAGSNWINNVTIIVHNETIQAYNFSSTLYNATYSVLNSTPRYINATAYGFNNDTGPIVNVSSQIQLRIARSAGQTSSPSISYLCSNETYSLNGTNVTMETIADIDTLLANYSVSVILPDQQVQYPLQRANSTNESLDWNFNYSIVTSLNGTYIISTEIKDIENQTSKLNTTFIVSNATKSVNVSLINVQNITLKDMCTGRAIAYYNPLLILPNYSYYDMNSYVSSALSLTFSNLTLSDSTNNTINYTSLTNETSAPLGKRRVALFDLTTNLTYKNITLAYNYSSLESTLTHESNLNMYKCDNLSNCSLDKQNSSIDTSLNIVTTSPSFKRARFMLTEPALNTIPEQLQKPAIHYINFSSTYTKINQTMNITVTFNISFQLKSITLTVNSTALNPIETSSAGSSYKYVYNFSPSSLGYYIVQTNVSDENTFNSNSSETFFTAQNNSISIQASGINNLTLKDMINRMPIASGLSINSDLPQGKYELSLVQNKTIVTMFNSSINNSVSTVFVFSDLPESITAPGNRTNLDQFEVNSSIGYSSIDFVYNYTNISDSISDQDNLEVYKCSNTTNCTWAEIASSIDKSAKTISFTVYNLSIFNIAESIRTQTETVTNTVTQTVTSTSSSSGGGGGSLVQVPQIVKLDIIIPQPMSMYLNDTLILPIIVKNTGERKINNMTFDIINHSDYITINMSKTKINSLGINESVLTNITFSTFNKTGRTEATFIVEGRDPSIRTSSKIYIDIIERYGENRTVVVEKIRFLADLFRENPECLELSELLKQAEESSNKGEFEKARALAESAINSCKRLIAPKNKKPLVEQPAKTFRLNLAIPLIIAGLLMIIALLIYFSKFTTFGKKHKQNSAYHARSEKIFEAEKTNIDEEKELRRLLSGRKK